MYTKQQINLTHFVFSFRWCYIEVSILLPSNIWYPRRWLASFSTRDRTGQVQGVLRGMENIYRKQRVQGKCLFKFQTIFSACLEMFTLWFKSNETSLYLVNISPMYFSL